MIIINSETYSSWNLSILHQYLLVTYIFWLYNDIKQAIFPLRELSYFHTQCMIGPLWTLLCVYEKNRFKQKSNRNRSFCSYSLWLCQLVSLSFSLALLTLAWAGAWDGPLPDLPSSQRWPSMWPCAECRPGSGTTGWTNASSWEPCLFVAWLRRWECFFCIYQSR